MGLDDKVVLLCAELAPGVFSQFIVEAFAGDEDVRVLSDGSHVWVERGDTVWMHGKVARRPRVRIESGRNSEALALVNQWKLVVERASDCLRVE